MIPIKMPREQREIIVKHIQTFFEEERSEQIGNLAAEQLLDFMIRELGPHLYNQGVEDARAFVAERMAGVDDELYAMKRMPAR